MEPVVFVTDEAPRYVADATPTDTCRVDEGVTGVEVLFPDGTHASGLAYPRLLTHDEIDAVNAWAIETYGH